MNEFLQKFYEVLENNQESLSITASNSNVSQYQDHVIRILNEHKDKALSEDELVKLQYLIESHTIMYDDIKIFS